MQGARRAARPASRPTSVSKSGTHQLRPQRSSRFRARAVPPRHGGDAGRGRTVPDLRGVRVMRTRYLMTRGAAALAAGCSLPPPADVDHDADLRDATQVDAAVDAAPVCVPDSIVCDEGTGLYVDCDSEGAPEVVIDCPLGCAPDVEKCLDVVASNGLTGYLDHAPRRRRRRELELHRRVDDEHRHRRGDDRRQRGRDPEHDRERHPRLHVQAPHDLGHAEGHRQPARGVRRRRRSVDHRRARRLGGSALEWPWRRGSW